MLTRNVQSNMKTCSLNMHVKKYALHYRCRCTFILCNSSEKFSTKHFKVVADGEIRDNNCLGLIPRSSELTSLFVTDMFLYFCLFE